ncbi:SusD/RagB family nutrient-binding outer membrane lipoprotein [Chitinophaga japonensis]|uniref:SusD-like starch-binding protein associating with outer membrane n=1 Tax=Chitinophaga japonensis TaxID=104662 RepID=A0A562TCN8_CHIJA|nr:SusD/RagB family nutrient-binding outer membrane lipoprotein [Chitinophaga japonensis]TWI91321.1 SusD-like starch-binding protein associating with outer membrane [Chitinophaga japonensis]
MLTRYMKYSCYLLLGCLLATGCQKLEDINVDPTKPTTTQPQYLLTGAEKSAMDIIYAGPQNGRIGMPYAQYWTGNDKANDSRYLLDEGINAALWNNLYSISLHNLDEIIAMNRAEPTPVSPNQIAIAHILKAWIYQVLADAYGNIPYTEALQEEGNIRPAYDDAQTIYNALLDTLQAQTAAMDPAQGSFDAGDVIYNGNVDAWKKLAHSLMLRLAIRMADADPARAQAVIAANYQQAMAGNADNAQFQYLATAPNKFPYNDSDRPLTEFFVSATLVDYMQSTGDPRLGIYARKAGDSTYRGLAYGTSETNPNRLPPSNYSLPGKKIYAADMPGILMTYPEVAFILAEAAARGFATGADAATHYEAGVRASMEYWGVSNTDSIGAYLARVPYDANDWKNVIGTQKWLALYPQGLQGWFERLRLDFKKPGGDSLFIAPLDGSLDENVTYVPYRLTYLVSEQQQNTANYQAAASAIGGNTKGVKLWWNMQ